jgi:hypothetical protein
MSEQRPLSERLHILAVCVDCAMLIANAEANPNWTQEQEEGHRTRMVERLSGLEAVSIGDDTDDWSPAPCDACGNRLAGTRYTATAWEAE